MRFKDKTSIVTGGGSGIGLETAKRLHEAATSLALIQAAEREFEYDPQGQVLHSAVGSKEHEDARRELIPIVHQRTG